MPKIIFIATSLLIFFTFCKKESFFSDSSAKLKFSADTVQFDTVFTTIGSATQNFKVYNPYSKPIKISSIYLAGGIHSFFRININGQSTVKAENVELDAKDSLFIFVEVHVDPNNQNNPMVVMDSVVFSINGNNQSVKLVACGQDVVMIDGNKDSGTISENTVWTQQKPYLVFNSMLVDSNVTLTITSGTKIFFHYGSRMYVKGTVIVNGNLDEPVIFRNDRLEHWYDDVPGQWAGIYFVMGSKDNILNFCEIKNAIIGIQADTFMNANPNLTLSNSKILNMNVAGIYGQGTSIYAWNCVIANCGEYLTALTIGGHYEFYHCTFYNNWLYANRQTPSLLLTNYYQDIHGNYQVRPITNATFGNCIIYGNKENEISFDSVPLPGLMNYKFQNCIVKADETVNTNTSMHWLNIFKNKVPGLKSPSGNDFSLDTLSFAKDKGDFLIGSAFPVDIKLNSRISDGFPDLGAYERIE
jgi:hypothetical protein